MVFFKNRKIKLIAEIANSHEGNADLAKKLIEKASTSGKFSKLPNYLNLITSNTLPLKNLNLMRMNGKI